MIKQDDIWSLQEAARYFRRQNRLEEAESYYKKALTIQPTDAGLLNGLGITYYDQKNYQKAEEYYQKSLTVIEGYTACHNNYALLLKELKRFDEAIKQYKLVLKYDADYIEAYRGLGGIYADIQQWSDAEQVYRQVLKKSPNDTRTQNNLAMVLLAQAKYDEGWLLYKARYASTNPQRFFSLPKINRPYWQGESLEGKTILVWREQGLGDCIQFCRYAAILKEKTAAKEVIITAKPEVVDLFSGLENIDQIVTSSGKMLIPKFDCWVMLLDIAHYLLNGNDPFVIDTPYFNQHKLPLQKWPLTQDKKKLKVGIVWQGNPEHANDKQRSIANIQTLKPLWDLANVEWYSLQKGLSDSESAAIAVSSKMIMMGNQVETFADTAAIIAQLDLVISIDSAVAHLAGLLNKPCWTLLPFVGLDWRWMSGREDTPWYPSMRLFRRQKDEQSWDETILRIKVALQELMDNNK